MKRFYAVIFTTLVFAGFVHANEPNSTTPAPASRTANVREWQKEEDRIMGHIRSNKLAAMKNASASIVGLFRDSILTEGSVNPVWHGEYFAGSRMHFGVRCLFNNEDNTNSDNDLTVFANDISPLMSGTITVNGKEYTTIKAATTVNGNITFDFDMDNSLHVKAWLITADSAALPYIPVTRKEYLEEAQKELEGLKSMAEADTRARIHVRSAAEQEAEKQQMLQQLKNNYSGAELEARTRVYLHNYIKDEDYLTQTIASNVVNYTAALQIIRSLLLGSTVKQLAQPAVVSVKAEDFRGFEDGRANTTALVRMNPAYFNSSDDQAPKCLLICWRYNPNDSHAAGIDSQLNTNFNSQSFKSLLTK